MATPRRRYPSDHRPYFRVVDDIVDDWRIASLKPADRWIYIELLAAANRSKDKSGRFELSWSGAMAVTGAQNHRNALAALLRLGCSGLADVSQDVRKVVIVIPKWAEIQGYAPTELRRDSDATPSLRGEERRSGKKTQEHSPSKTRESGVATAPPPSLDDPKRWVSILGQEAGSDEEKLVFTTRELPLAVAEAEEHHPSDRKAQRGKIKSVLIRHYRWQREHPVPMRAQANGSRRPVTFAEQSAINTKQAARDAMAIFDARRKEQTDARGILEAGGSSEAHPTHPPLLGPRH